MSNYKITFSLILCFATVLASCATQETATPQTSPVGTVFTPLPVPPSTASFSPIPDHSLPIVFNLTPKAGPEFVTSNRITLTIQEYPLLSGTLDPLLGSDLPTETECVAINRALTDGPWIAEWKSNPTVDAYMAVYNTANFHNQTTLTETNQLLQPFGYRLEAIPPETASTGQLYRLHKGNQTIDLYGYEPVILNSVGTDFAWLVYDDALSAMRVLSDLTRNGQLVQRNGWQPITQLRAGPVYLGDQLLIARYVDEAVVVEIDGQTVYMQDIQTNGDSQPPFTGYCPVRSLEIEDGHWRLHTLCDMVLDGVSLHQQAGVDEVHSWVRLAGEPFYLFRQNRQVGLNYAGQKLPLTFDEVYHTYFPISTMCRVRDFLYAENMVWFFAKRQGNWYIVKVDASATELPK